MMVLLPVHPSIAILAICAMSRTSPHNLLQNAQDAPNKSGTGQNFDNRIHSVTSGSSATGLWFFLFLFGDGLRFFHLFVQDFIGALTVNDLTVFFHEFRVVDNGREFLFGQYIHSAHGGAE